ncbi:MAG: extracellular solute-binding protein, partial [Chloroflexota bacterium]
KNGDIIAIPQSGVIQLFFYRDDLYKSIGMGAPQTWDDVEKAAKELNKPSQPLYGFVNRGGKGDTITWDWLAFYLGYSKSETGIFKDPPHDWTVTIDTPEAKEALGTYLLLAKTAPPNVGNIGLAEQINLLAGGKAAAAVVAAAGYSTMDDPKQSAVVNKIQYAVVPKPAKGRHATMSGPFVLGIPNTLPEPRQHAAMDFFKWSVTKEAQVEFLKAGSIPVRTDAYTAPGVAADPRFRFGKAMVASADSIHPYLRIPEGPQIFDKLGLRLNQALVGQMKPDQALKTAQDEVTAILKGAGYKM